jgi:hypothetical protein
MDPTPKDLAKSALGALFVLSLSLFSIFVIGPAADLRNITGRPEPDLAFLATPSSIDLYLRALGDAGRQAYAQVELVDYINAGLVLVTGVLMIRWLAALLPPDVRWPRSLMLFPLLAGLLDAAENLLMIRTIHAFPNLTPSILPWITSAKLLCILFTLLSVAALAAIALRLRRLAPVQL